MHISILQLVNSHLNNNNNKVKIFDGEEGRKVIFFYGGRAMFILFKKMTYMLIRWARHAATLKHLHTYYWTKWLCYLFMSRIAEFDGFRKWMLELQVVIDVRRWYYSIAICNFLLVFTARGYAKRGICRRRVSVCVSVCLSHSGIVSKRLYIGSRKQRRMIAPWF